MPTLMKLLRRKKKPKQLEKVSTPTTADPSPTPSTLSSIVVPTPVQPVLLHPEKDINDTSKIDDDQKELVENTAASTSVAAPIAKPDEKVETPPKVEKKSKTKVHDITLKILDPLIDAFGIAKAGAEAAADIGGPLKAAFGIAERVSMMVRGAVANDKAWVELADILEDHKGILKQNREVVKRNEQVSSFAPPEDDFEPALIEYARVLETIYQKVDEGKERFRKKRAMSYLMQLPARTQAEHIQRLTEELNRSWNFLQGKLNMIVMRTTRRIEEHVAHIRIAQTLQVADARGASVGTLLSGTRTEILERISSWADGDLEKQILWLCDGPGTGKSTIAAHMAKEWREKGQLAGSFFFSQDDEHTRDLGRFCATIAKQTLEAHPVGEHYIVTLPRDPSFLPFFEKFDLLCKGLLEYLSQKRVVPSKEDSTPTPAVPKPYPVAPLIMVIDSLDQCDPYDQTRLLNALLHHLPAIASVKVLLTSTPLHDTHHDFHNSNKVLKSEIVGHDSRTGQRDIELYVRERLDGNLALYQQDQVIDSANGVFQLAAVACSFLEKAIHPNANLAQLVSMKRDSTFSNLYTTILDGIKEEQLNVEESINAIRTVLQAVVLAYRPVTIATHHAFLPKMDGVILNYVERIISFLRGIVKVGGEKGDGPVYILHPTFRNYLLSLSPTETFNIAAPAGHAFMGSGCLELLRQLKYDLCGVASDRDIPLPISNLLELPEQVLKRFGTDNSTPLRYGVVFWARHVAEGLIDEDLRTKLVPFFERQLLSWIEWAAAIRELPECIVGLEHLFKRLEPHVHLNAPKDESALKWCEDALRFLKRHQDIIGQSSMQVYYSALAFDPRDSLVSAHYQTSIPHALPNVTGHLGRDRVHQSHVTAITLSRNGHLIASAGDDLSIYFWDGDTRDPLGVLPKVHKSSVTSMAFSADMRILASCSTDGVVLVWQVDLAAPSDSTHVVLKGEGRVVDCMSLSEDNTSVIFVYADDLVGIWSIAQKECIASYTIPELASPVPKESEPEDPLSNATTSPSSQVCSIALSRDRRTVALSRGSQLRVFHLNHDAAFEFLTIRYGVPAQPVFSRTLTTRTKNIPGTDEYLYWGNWILRMADYQRDRHRYISEASTAEAELSSELESAGPACRPSSLLYATKAPSRISSYRLEEDAGLLLLPVDMEITCWAASRAKIVVGTEDGRVMLVEFADSRILGKGGEDLREGTPSSDDGYETASDGPEDGEDDDDDALSADFMSAVEGTLTRRGSAVPA